MLESRAQSVKDTSVVNLTSPAGDPKPIVGRVIALGARPIGRRAPSTR